MAAGLRCQKTPHQYIVRWAQYSILPSSSCRYHSRKASSVGATPRPPLPIQRVVDVAIVGLPNAGKSSLLNALLAKRMAAVSSKRNTTRTNLLAVAADYKDGVEVSFYDTPGFVDVADSAMRSTTIRHHRQEEEDDGDGDDAAARPPTSKRAPEETRRAARRSRVERSVMVSAREAARRVDLTLLVVDAAKRLDRKKAAGGAHSASSHREQLEGFAGGILGELARREAPALLREDDVRERGDEATAMTLSATAATRRRPWRLLLARRLAARVAGSVGLVLNKVDLVEPKQQLLPTTLALHASLASGLLHAARRALKDDPRVCNNYGDDDDGDGGGDDDDDDDDYEGEAEDDAASLEIPVFMVSATERDGISALREFLHRAARRHPWRIHGSDEDGEWNGVSRGGEAVEDGDCSTTEKDNGVDLDLVQHLREGESSYDEITSELDDVEFVEECVREKVFAFVHKEVPYRVAQKNRFFGFRSSSSGTGEPATALPGPEHLEKQGEELLEIHQDLLVGSRSHKRMVIGPKGATLRLIQTTAQQDLEAHFGLPVHLRLWVRET